jgi:RecA-family ATPase
MQVMAADPIQIAKGVAADRRFARARAESPDRDDWQPPTDIPPSADGEPIVEPSNGATTAPAEIQPFETFDASQWEGVPIEPRRWIAENRIPVGEPGIMSGDGGTGKTKLALQLAVTIAAGLQDWIGGIVEADGPVIVFSAEEKLKEMHRRTLDILDHRRLSFSSLRGHLHFICDQDQTVLGAIDRNGVVQPTTSLLRLEKTVAAIRPALVIIENAADVYSGNESDRPNVTRFMRGLLGRLTGPCESTVMLIQHPSVSGLSDGTGRSGSTGWNNSGRWRLNFTKAKDSDELRQLEIAKNNYGPTGEKITLRWERGVFVPESQADASPYRAAAERQIDDLFLQLLDKRNAQARHVRPSKGPGYAPSEFAADPEAGAVTARAFSAAMERLYSAGIIKTVETGPASRRFRHVERAVP